MPFQSRRARLVIEDEPCRILERIARSRSESAQRVERARILLAYAVGQTVSAIARDDRPGPGHGLPPAAPRGPDGAGRGPCRRPGPAPLLPQGSGGSLETELIDYSLGYSGTLAPLVVKDMVMVGTAGGEYGIRGFIDAFDVETGERRWRFYTVPGPGEFGNDTWSGDSWKTGGASIWITPGYDPELNLVYWGVGNPRIRASASGTSGSPLTTSMTGTPRKSWC